MATGMSTVDVLLAILNIGFFVFETPRIVAGISGSLNPPDVGPRLQIPLEKLREVFKIVDQYHTVMTPDEVEMILASHARYKSKIQAFKEEPPAPNLTRIWSKFCGHFTSTPSEEDWIKELTFQVADFHSIAQDVSERAAIAHITARSAEEREATRTSLTDSYQLFRALPSPTSSNPSGNHTQPILQQ
ncbi:hypothetical protein BD779DRAFT_1679869 [Infundibulicybe gibba]|nr:hypothetical protein BD779DRAFT_1679869 [Infundibulicybe gibba]